MSGAAIRPQLWDLLHDPVSSVSAHHITTKAERGCAACRIVVRTREDVFVYPRELDVRFGRVSDDETVDDALGDGHRDCVAEETLDLYA